MLSFQTFGQGKSANVSVKWGPEIEVSKKAWFKRIVGFDGTGVYATQGEKKGLTIFNQGVNLERYSNRLILSKSVELDLKSEKKKRQLEFIIQLDGRMYVFSSYMDQKIKRNFLFVQPVNKRTLVLEGELKKIAEIDYEGNTKYNAGYFNYKLGRDSTKLLIYYDLPYDKGESEKFGFHVFDEKFDQIWEKKVVLPYKEEFFSIEDYEVDGNGNVHVLGLIWPEKREKETDVSLRNSLDRRHQILSYSNMGNELIEYPIDLDGKFLTEMQIAINDEQDVICGGLYSTEGTRNIEGSYFVKIDGKTKEIESREFKAFGIDFITQDLSDRKVSKAKRKSSKGKSVDLLEYVLDDLVLRKDGGAVLIGEQYSLDKISSSDARGFSSTINRYEFNDIIVVSMSPNGEIEWMEKVAKRQVTRHSSKSSSYALSIVNDKLHFFFNENPKNLAAKKEGKFYFFRPESSVLVLVTLDKEGKQTKEALFAAEDVGVVILPSSCRQIAENKMLLVGFKEQNIRLAKITFNK